MSEELKAAVAAGVVGSQDTFRSLLESVVEVARAIFSAKASSIFILDEENRFRAAEAVAIAPLTGVPLLHTLEGPRQVDPEPRALPGLAVAGKGPLVGFDDFADRGEAESAPPRLRRIERLKQLGARRLVHGSRVSSGPLALAFVRVCLRARPGTLRTRAAWRCG